jgi:hypothetical protein
MPTPVTLQPPARHPRPRSNSGVSPERCCFTVSCDAWTFHSLEFYLQGRPPVEHIREIEASVLHPEVRRRWFRDPLSGRPRIRGYSIIAHFSSPETTRLLSLGEIAARLDASLGEFPWLRDPRLSVSRIDLASDHLVSIPPAEVCDLIAQVNLPHSQRISTYREDGDPYSTVYHVSGRRSLDPIPFEKHHRKGKQPVVVAHYPRLEALLARRGPEGVSAAATEYTRDRLRQEVRFRREAIRRCIGPGSATVEAVLGSVPAFVRAAERRLRPMADVSVLALPILDAAKERQSGSLRPGMSEVKCAAG